MIVTIDHNNNADRPERLDQNSEVQYWLYRTSPRGQLALINGTILDYKKDVTLQKVRTFEYRKFRKKLDNKPKLVDFKRDLRFLKAKEWEQAEDVMFVDELAGDTGDTTVNPKMRTTLTLSLLISNVKMLMRVKMMKMLMKKKPPRLSRYHRLSRRRSSNTSPRFRFKLVIKSRDPN